MIPQLGVALMTYVIRPENEEDREWILTALLGIQAHEHSLHNSRLPAEPRSAKRYLDILRKTLVENHGIILVALSNDRPVGLIIGHVVDEPWPVETADSTVYAYISDIFILPEHRGSGLANLLFQAVAEHFRALPLQLKRLRVNVLAGNGIACAAYEKAGFSPYEVMYERSL
jgi:ribosomal protein S18 acetylase RimI-like enzyme